MKDFSIFRYYHIIIFFVILLYFIYHLLNGENGWYSYKEWIEKEKIAKSELLSLRKQRQILEKKIKSLSINYNSDYLDEIIRSDIGVSNPNENIVILNQ